MNYKAKKSFGQNFLVDNNIIKKIADEVTSNTDDLVIEIGPGMGALTKELKKKNSFLLAYELDKDLNIYLNPLLDEKTNIIYKDFLNTNIKDDIKDIDYNDLYFVGNLPYYITTPIIEHIVDSNIGFKSFTLMVQKEVADRFMAKPGSKEYGYFTVLINYYFDVRKVTDVSKKCFNPIPKVNSTVLTFINNKKYAIDETRFFGFIKECFKQKRKTLRNNLGNYNFEIVKKVLLDNGFDEQVRAEQLPLDIFIELFKVLL